jgi:hypothetical protein
MKRLFYNLFMATDVKESVLPTESSTDSKQKEIPLTLREYGEIPKAYVPVYIVVDKDRLDLVGEHGLRTTDNQMGENNPELEEIFEKVAQEKNIRASRLNSVFAYPKSPDKIAGGMSFDDENQVLLEAKIDPSTALVVDGSNYTEAGEDLRHGNENGARVWAKSYWEQYISLSNYRARGFADEKSDVFSFPEVLIPEDIPTSRLKVVEGMKP